MNPNQPVASDAGKPPTGTAQTRHPSRRDFLQTAAVAAGSTALASSVPSWAQAAARPGSDAPEKISASLPLPTVPAW